MSVLDRSALEASPLADLHAIASELGLDGFRRLRKAELIDAILARQSGAEEDTEVSDEADVAPAEADVAPAEEKKDEREEAPAARRRRSRRGGRGRARADERPAPAEDDDEEADAGDREVEGVVELLANGSGFVRVSPPEPSDDDVYVSAAQVRRCELVSGDTIAGPVRRPRRSERYPSLIRVDTINGRPADEVAEGTRYDDLPAAFPSERIELGGDDPTLKAIEWLTPFGKGSRVTIAGPARAGKTEALRQLAGALAEREGLVVSVALAGVRPEEITEWSAGPVPVAASAGLSASVDAQGQAVEHGVEQARRIAARGGDAVVLVDSLDGVAPSAARRALAGARRFPALDVLASGTLRPELLVGEAGAEALAQARAEALEERAR